MVYTGTSAAHNCAKTYIEFLKAVVISTDHWSQVCLFPHTADVCTHMIAYLFYLTHPCLRASIKSLFQVYTPVDL